MANYLQTLKSTDLGRRNLWYIVGPEKALVQDALEVAKAHALSGVTLVNTVVFIGGDASGVDVCSTLLSGSFYERTVVILLDAEKFSGWDELQEAFKVLPRTSFFIAVDNSDSVDTKQSHMRYFVNSAKSRYVSCSSLSEEDMLLWLDTRLHIRKEAARYLIDRSNKDHEWLLNVCRKLQYLEGVIPLDVVEQICQSYGSPDFTNSLLNYKKRDAILAMEDTSPGAREAALLFTNSRKSALLSEAVRAVGKGARVLTSRTHLSAKELGFYRPTAKYYDRSNMTRCFGTLYGQYPKLVRGDRWAWEITIVRW